MQEVIYDLGIYIHAILTGNIGRGFTNNKAGGWSDWVWARKRAPIPPNVIRFLIFHISRNQSYKHSKPTGQLVAVRDEN